jgi:hypothetical protein
MTGVRAMTYTAFEQAFDELSAPLNKISGLYDNVLTGLDQAVQIDAQGAATVDATALHDALDFAPGADKHFSRATSGIGHGFAMVTGGAQPTPVVPWSAFLDAQALRPFDKSFWTGLGYQSGPARISPGGAPPMRPGARPGGAGGRVRPGQPASKVFAAVANDPPAEVVDPTNLAMLDALAKNAADYDAQAAAMISPVPAAATMYLQPLNLTRITIPAPNDTATSTQHLTAADFQPIVSCLPNAKARLVGGFVLEICLDRACADALETILSLGTGTVLGLGLAALSKGFITAVTAAAGALGAGIGGWIALGIIVSAAYWALMIHFNKTPKGVCLEIPMPWTFGLIGPGWATGIR